jgi:putative ATP-binding cassette transporter
MRKRIAGLFGGHSAGGAAEAAADPALNPVLNPVLNPAKRAALLGETGHATAVAGMRSTWGLLSAFWKSEHKKRAYAYTGIITGLTLFDVFLGVKLAEWSKDILDAFIARDVGMIAKESAIFMGGIAVGYASMYAGRSYTEKNLQILWRGWLTQQFTDAWLTKKAFFHLNNSHAIPSPDQRIADDPNKLTGNLVGLTTGAIYCVTSLVAFTGVLLKMSGTHPATFMNVTMQVPNLFFYLGFGAAAACSIAGTALNGKLGMPLVVYNDELLRKEGDLRSSLFEISNNSGSIASYPDQNVERRKIAQEFKQLRKSWIDLSWLQSKISFTSGMVGDAAKLAGMGIGGANYMMSSTLTAGSIFQYASIFDQLRGSMSWLMYVSPTLFEIKTLSNRLTDFANKIEIAQNPADLYALSAHEANIKLREEPRDSIRVRNFTLKGSSSDHVLYSIADLEIKPGDRVLITGHSGSGKSLLVQSMYGLWKHGEGEIAVPAGKSLLFAPQVPYVLPEATLRDNVVYPSHLSASFSDDDVRAALKTAELEHLIPYLDQKTRDKTQWKALSVGEKQRLTFARIFLHKPEILFLDEATSGLDNALNEKMYSRLVQALPNSTIVSIAHRDGLSQHHTRHMDIHDKKFHDLGAPQPLQVQPAAAKPVPAPVPAPAPMPPAPPSVPPPPSPSRGLFPRFS